MIVLAILMDIVTLCPAASTTLIAHAPATIGVTLKLVPEGPDCGITVAILPRVHVDDAAIDIGPSVVVAENC
jgi:hypothetical protein